MITIEDLYKIVIPEILNAKTSLLFLVSTKEALSVEHFKMYEVFELPSLHGAILCQIVTKLKMKGDYERKIKTTFLPYKKQSF